MSRKIIFSIFLLGMILLSFLILPNFSSTPTLTSEQNSQTQDYIVRDNVPPKLSAPAPDIFMNKTSTITASADDAWNNNGGTTYDEETIPLGGHRQPWQYAQRRVCLRWNITIPAKSHIVNAYINLTVASTASFNGFSVSVLAFTDPSTPDFSNTGENVNSRAKTTGVSWTTASSYSINATFLTPDISSILEQVLLLDGWNGIIGVILVPYSINVQNPNEMINFWSYDHGNLTHTPKLYIEWEDTPYFSDIPTDLTINNGTLGYHIEWTALDGNPTNYTIIGNESLTDPPTRYNDTWQSNVEIRYDIPKINISSYISVIVNYTIYVRDADGNFERDTVLITVTDKILPVIEIKLVQDGKTFSHLDRDYFMTGKGPFTLQIYNSTPFTPTVKLTALYPENQLEFWTTVQIIGMPLLAQIIFKNISDTITYTEAQWWALNYNVSGSGCWQLTPYTLDNYAFIGLPYIGGVQIGDPIPKYVAVNSITYNLRNIFSIENANEFIYNQTVYGGNWGSVGLTIENRDMSPPLYEEPKFIEPDEPDLHYEISILTYIEANGAAIDGVFLYYKIDDGAWKKTKTAFQDGKYYGEVPPQDGGAEITYYLEIVDLAGNIVKTDEFEETAVTFEEISPIVPILGILLAFLGALSLVVIYRIKSKRALKKAIPEKIMKKPKKGLKKVIKK